MDLYDIGQAFAGIEAELIASMIRNMKRHRAEETKEGFQWTQWQAEQLKALEAYKKANKKKYGKKFHSINNMLAEAIKEARAQGNMDQEIEILEALKKGFARYSRVNADVLGEFFKLNDRKLDALIKATKEDFEKGEQAILRMAEDQYRQIIFNAQVYANTGAGTYEKAVDMATKDFLERGINCIEYSNGARHTMSDYADMAIRTATKRAYLVGEGEKRMEWGIYLVIVNKRGNPCPKCLPFVGKILIDDVYSGGSKEDGNYPLLSRAMELGLYHPRCKDSHSTYFEGISTPPDDHFTEKDIEEIKDGYTDEQKRNVAQHNYQKYSRMAEHSLDKENQQKYAARAEYWKGEYARYYQILNVSNVDKYIEKYPKNGIINIEIDELTPCLRRMSDGKIVQTKFVEIKPTKKDFKDWEFDWTIPIKDGYSVYGLMAEGDKRIQGLIAMKPNARNYAYQIDIVEAAPFNNPHNPKFKKKEYNGVGGHLFAEAVRKSLEEGFGGAVFFTAKSDLIDYYIKELGAELTNPRLRLMFIDEDAAIKLYNRYYGG